MGTEKTVTKAHKLLTWRDELIDANPGDKWTTARFDVIRNQTTYIIEMYGDSADGPPPNWGKFAVPAELLDVTLVLLQQGKLVEMIEVDDSVYARAEKDMRMSGENWGVLPALGATKFGNIYGVDYFINLASAEHGEAIIQYMDGRQRKELVLSAKAIEAIRTI